MDTLIYILFVSLSAPLLLMMLLLTGRARMPVAFMLVGIFVAVFSAELNGVLTEHFALSRFEASIKIAPITEELMKATPLLFYAMVISDKREDLFTVAMAVGIGFAIMENAFYLIVMIRNFSFVSALIRGFGTGLMHGMCTLLVGLGVSFIKKKKKLFAVGTFSLLTAAIIYHSIFNMLIQSKYSIVGALIPIATYIPFFVWRNFKKKKKKPISGGAEG